MENSMDFSTVSLKNGAEIIHPGRDDGSLWFHPGGLEKFLLRNMMD